MPTLLDSLIIKLGIDASGFRTDVAQTEQQLQKVGTTAIRQSSQLEEYLKKTQRETVARIKQVDTVGRQMSQQFNNIRNGIVGMLAAITGATGIAAFVKNITDTDASVGRLANILGTTTEELSAWGEAAKRFGGSTEATGQSLMNLSNQFQQLKATGQSEVVPFFRALHVALTDATGELRPFRDIMLDLADRFSHMAPAQASYFGRSIGLDQGTINLLMKGREEVTKYLAEAERLGVIHQKDADAAIAFQNALMDLEQPIKDVGRAIFSDLEPHLVTALGTMKDWILANKSWMESGLAKWFTDLGVTVSKIPEMMHSWIGEFGLITAAAVPFFLALSLGFGPITAAVAAIVAGLAIIKTTFQEMDPKNFAPGSPMWRGMSEQEQLQYPNSPASIARNGQPGGGSGSWLLDQFQRFFGGGGSGGAGGATDARKTEIRDKLAADPRLGISRDAAAGLVSNANAESGIAGINEVNPVSGRGGFGWMQWTGSRRIDFEQFAAKMGLDPASDEANYEFLISELTTNPKYASVLQQLRNKNISATDAAAAVAAGYVVAPENTRAGHVAQAQATANLPSKVQSDRVYGPPSSRPGQHSAIDPGMRFAMRSPAANSVVNNSPVSNTSSAETHINGPINIQTAATDAQGIAKGIGQALQKYSFVPQAARGLA